MTSPDNTFILDANIVIHCQTNLKAKCSSSLKQINQLQCLLNNKASLTSGCLNALYPQYCSIGSILPGCPQLTPSANQQKSGMSACQAEKDEYCHGKSGPKATQCMISIYAQLSADCQAAMNAVAPKSIQGQPSVLVTTSTSSGCGFFDGSSGNPVSVLAQVDLSTIVNAAYVQSQSGGTTAPPQTIIGNAASSLSSSITLVLLLSLLAAVFNEKWMG